MPVGLQVCWWAYEGWWDLDTICILFTQWLHYFENFKLTYKPQRSRHCPVQQGAPLVGSSSTLEYGCGESCHQGKNHKSWVLHCCIWWLHAGCYLHCHLMPHKVSIANWDLTMTEFEVCQATSWDFCMSLKFNTYAMRVSFHTYKMHYRGSSQ